MSNEVTTNEAQEVFRKAIINDLSSAYALLGILLEDKKIQESILDKIVTDYEKQKDFKESN